MPVVQVALEVVDSFEESARGAGGFRPARPAADEAIEAAALRSDRFRQEREGDWKRLEAIVKQASPGNRSCAIANQSPLALTGREVYPRVVVQVRLRCGAPELASVLHQIESGSPRLFVENLNILAQRYAFQASETGAGGLDVNFDLYGYLKPSPATPREPARAP